MKSKRPRQPKQRSDDFIYDVEHSDEDKPGGRRRRHATRQPSPADSDSDASLDSEGNASGELEGDDDSEDGDTAAAKSLTA